MGIPHFTVLGVSDWPDEAADAFQQGDPLRPLYFGFFHREVHWHVTTIGLRKFVFLSTTESPPRLVYWEEHARGENQMILQSDEAGYHRQLMFEVASFGGEIVLVYATVDAIMQMVGAPTDAGLEFSEPALLRRVANHVVDLRLAPSTNQLHLLWTEGGVRGYEGKLYYASTLSPRGGWSEPQRFSETANTNTANLVADHRRLTVAWSDFRFRERRWDSYTNDGQVFVLHSVDEGTSWSRPLLVEVWSKKVNGAARLFATLDADRNIVLCWSAEAAPRWSGHWHVGILERHSTVLTRGGTISSEQLLGSYANRMAKASGW